MTHEAVDASPDKESVAKADVPDKGSDFGELGITGLNQFGGFVHEEFLQELMHQRGSRIYIQMRDNSPIVGAYLFAIEMLVRSVEWTAKAASDSPEDQDRAQFLQECMDDMEVPWSSVMCEILTFLVFGWSLLEEVYKIRGGDVEDPKRKSRFSDGKIGWRKLPGRAQETLWRWIFNEDGTVVGMVQQAPPDYKVREIPMSKALLFRTTARKGNPEGRSTLRNAYRPFFFMTRIEEIEAVGTERDLAGLPIGFIPSKLLKESASEEEKATARFFREILQNVRRDVQEGVLWPSDRDDKGNRLFEFELLSSGGKRNFDTSKIINRYALQILMSVLADFIMLGHEKVGSFALSSDKTSLFSVALKAFLQEIADVFNRIAIPRLFALNGISGEALPTLAFSDLESPNVEGVVESLMKLANAGADGVTSDEIVNQIMRWLGLPEVEKREE